MSEKIEDNRMPPVFLVHPVSPALKYAVKRKGFRILDARYAPEGYEQPAEVAELLKAPEITPAASGGDGPQKPRNKA